MISIDDSGGSDEDYVSLKKPQSKINIIDVK